MRVKLNSLKKCLPFLLSAIVLSGCGAGTANSKASDSGGNTVTVSHKASAQTAGKTVIIHMPIPSSSEGCSETALRSVISARAAVTPVTKAAEPKIFGIPIRLNIRKV